jgi:hypothetical protein
MLKEGWMLKVGRQEGQKGRCDGIVEGLWKGKHKELREGRTVKERRKGGEKRWRERGMQVSAKGVRSRVMMYI